MTEMLNWPAVVFSSDVDWASEACLEDTYAFAKERGIRPSFFATHESRTLSRLSQAGEAELAVHPNFLPGSSHGNNLDEVIGAVMRLVPAAKGFRSHYFVDSTLIARAFKARGLIWDSNLCLFLQDGIVPLRHASGLIRLPVFWADDVHMALRPGDWNVDAVMSQFLSPGLKILDVHPIHLALNSPDDAFYQRHKGQAKTLTAAEIAELRHRSEGTRTFLHDLIGRLRNAGVRFYTFDALMNVLSRFASSSMAAAAGRTDQLSAEDHQRYWSMSPDDRQEMIRQMYNKRNAVDHYATSRDHNQRELEIAALRASLDTDRVSRVVDLGCGNGYTLLSLSRDLANAHLTGVDFAENLIDGAKKLACEFRGSIKSEPEFVCGDAIAFVNGLADCSVDCVITERFLLNLPDHETQRRVIHDIFRVLVPGGRLLMCEGSLDGFRNLNELRRDMGLAEIAETSAENVSSVRFEDAEIEHFVTEKVGFDLVSKLGFSTFFAVSRALYPALIAPQSPAFDSPVNNLAREMQLHLPLTPGLGSNVLWVLTKPTALH